MQISTSVLRALTRATVSAHASTQTGDSNAMTVRVAGQMTGTQTAQTWTSVRPTMAIATANAHAPTRRVVAPVATVRVVGPTREIRNAKVGVV